MRKSTPLLVFLICLLFNIITATPSPTFAVNIFKEGIYRTSDFNFSLNNLYTIKNISPTDGVYVAIFNENHNPIQSVKLVPKSLSYRLLPLKPTDRVMIIGGGEVFISELQSK